MAKKIKTYGVFGLMEWQAEIPMGHGKMYVMFQGGAANAYGITPAEYTTDNAAVQAVIETSLHFRQGKIKLLRTVDVPEPEKASPVVAPAEGGEKKDVRSIDSVKNMNDAATWFAEEYGEVVTTKDEVKALCAKYGVKFPKMK